MNDKIVFENGIELICPIRTTAPLKALRIDRPYQRIAVEGEYADIKAAFLNPGNYKRVYESEKLNEDGTTKGEIHENDLSEYCIFEELVEKKDGTIWVYMSKKTDLELANEANSEMESILFAELGGVV